MRALIMANPISDFFNALGFLKPVLEVLLGTLYRAFHGVPVLDAIGAYGLAIIALTLIIKSLLFPVFQMQLKLSKKAQAEQRKVAPELAVLRKKYKGDPTALNREMMALYKEHGIHPLSSMAGCLPALVQMPILIGLYRAIIDPQFFKSLGVTHKSFLFVPDLTHAANLHDPITWILPALVGFTTFVQSKMFVPPQAPGAADDPQAAQMAQVSQTMSLMMPLFLIYLSFIPSFSLGLVLYYTISNCYSITQQYFVNGWGALPILGTKPEKPEQPAARGGGKGNERGREGVSKVLVTEPDLRNNPRRRRKR